MALALNIGLAICCGGLLAWNLRLSRRERGLRMVIEALSECVVKAATGDIEFVVDEFGYTLRDPDPPPAVH